MELEKLIETSGENAETKGFHDDGNILRDIISSLPVTHAGGVLMLGDRAIDIPEGFWERLYAAYQGNRLMLIVSEIVEAHDEVRNGKPSIYFDENGKPEGVATELGDATIRIGDYAWEFEEPVTEAITVKQAFNATRERMHGGKAF